MVCWQSPPTNKCRLQRRQEKMQREMDRDMGHREQTILVVSDDAALCAAVRQEFEASIAGLRGASVTSVAAARRILEEDAPVAIVLEEAAISPEADRPRGIVARVGAGGASPAKHGAGVVIRS